MNGTGAERREHQRFPMKVAVEATHGDSTLAFTSEDLSVGGAKVVGAGSLPVGEQVDITVALPGRAAPLAAKAEVRWSRGGALGLRFGRAAQAALAAFFAGVVGLSGMTAGATTAAVPTFDPNASTELSSDGSERPDEYVLLGAFERQREAMDRCVEQAKSGEDVTLTGTATMEVLLNPAGHRPLGINGTVSEDAPQDTSLVECLRAATASAPYPGYDGPPVVVEFDFELDAGFEIED
ncbi:MAG: PilZ domain-containing protein [Myxococcota bacterium]